MLSLHALEEPACPHSCLPLLQQRPASRLSFLQLSFKLRDGTVLFVKTLVYHVASEKSQKAELMRQRRAKVVKTMLSSALAEGAMLHPDISKHAFNEEEIVEERIIEDDIPYLNQDHPEWQYVEKPHQTYHWHPGQSNGDDTDSCHDEMDRSTTAV